MTFIIGCILMKSIWYKYRKIIVKMCPTIPQNVEL
nr:MAG TPA: hypothetical protein [Herelleviridae sp.]